MSEERRKNNSYAHEVVGRIEKAFKEVVECASILNRLDCEVRILGGAHVKAATAILEVERIEMLLNTREDRIFDLRPSMGSFGEKRGE